MCPLTSERTTNSDAPAAGRVEHISCSQRLLNWLASNLLMRQVGGFSPGTPVSSTNKSDCHDITEILLKSGVKHNNHDPNPIS
jgi:hypothetical protein